MPKELILASFDIGGTGVRGGAVSPEGELTTKVQSQAHPYREEPDQAAKRLRDFALRVYKNVLKDEQEVCAIGVGMPGPADYEQGILKVLHKPTLAPLYGRDLRKIFALPPAESGSEQPPVFFVNDGDALGIGAIEAYPNEPALLVVGLGTGLASSFAINNKLLTKEDGVSELWNMPFRAGILEDYVSRNAIIRSFEAESRERGFDVKEIAEKARENNQAAQQAFYLFGEALGESLAFIAADFHPTRIVIGGKIAIGAFDQFGEIAQRVFIRESSGSEVKFSRAKNDNLPLLGAARYAQNQLFKRS